MASADPLLPSAQGSGSPTGAGSPTSGGGSPLTLGMVVKLKAKARRWKNISAEKAMEDRMAPGMGPLGRNAGRLAKRASQVGLEGEPEGELEEELQSNSDAVTNILNNCLGSGVLAMPHFVKMLGIPLSIVIMLISPVLNRYTLLLVLKSCDLAGVTPTSYNGVAKAAFGNVGRIAVMFVFTIIGFGALVSYMDATVDSLYGLLQVAGFGITKKTTLLVSAFVCFPATYIRALTSVATLSFAAFIGALVVLACVLVRCSTLLGDFPSTDAIRWTPVSFMAVLAFTPTGILVFACQAGGSIVMSALKDDSHENKSKVSGIAFSILTVIFISVSLPAYLTFLDDTSSDILEAFDPSSIVTTVAKIAVLDLVVLSYMFMMIPVRIAMIELFFKKNEGKMEATYSQFLIVTTCLNLAAVFVASMCSDLGLVQGLIGCVGANLVAFILPSCIAIKINSAPKNKDVVPIPVLSPRNVPFFILIVISTFSMCSGSYLLITGQGGG